MESADDPKSNSILLAEADEALRRRRGDALRAAGFEVREAVSGEEALAAAVARPALAILSIHLPAMAAKELRARFKSIPGAEEIPLLHTGSPAAAKELGDEPGAFISDAVDTPVLVSAVKRRLRLRAAEKALCESEARFKGAFESAVSGMAIISPMGRLLKVNRALCRMLARAEAVLENTDLADVVHPDDRASLANTLALMASGRANVVRGPGRMLAAGGEAISVLFSVGVVRKTACGVDCLVAQVQDITYRRKNEEALKAAAEQWRATFDAIAEPVWMMDTDFRILRCNKATTKQLGLEFKEIIGRRCYELIHKTDAPPESCAMRRMLESKSRQSAAFEREGRYLSATVDPIFGPDGEVTGAIYQLKDRTDEERRARALKDTERQLLQAQKMEAVGRLAGGVAHDFNNLLTVITGNAQLILADSKGDDALREDILEINRAAEKAAELTRQLLIFSRSQVGRPQPLDLNEVLSDLEKMLRRIIGEDIELRLERAPEIGHILCDPVQIDQVIMNLAVNARDAMDKGGRITVTTAQLIVDGEAGFHLSPGNYVLMSVSDTGCGMSEEVLARIFEPFFTTKAAGKGTGLGLSTVYGIVKQAGGHIDAQSEVGKGTTFRIFFPAVGAADLPKAAAPGTIERFRGDETILLAEDEEGVRKLAQRILEGLGYTILAAEDGSKALELLKAGGKRIDLLLSDVIMPNMNGPDLQREVERLCPGVRVVFMSGYMSAGLRERAGLTPGSRFIDKPFTPTTLAAVVRGALDSN